MDDKGKISIIVPIYNAEEYLCQCIDSLVNQSYANIEIILVNDGSKDNSLDICRRYAECDSRIVVVSKENGGVSSARNVGLDKATGEYVLFCDSDDYAAREWCAEMVAAYRQGGLTVCDNYLFSVKKNKNHMIQPVDNTRTKTVLYDNGEFESYFKYNFGAPWNKIFSRVVIKNKGIRFPEELSLGEDLIFSLKYLAAVHGKVQIIPNRLYYYRVEVENSLANRAPSIEQCELFYEMLTNSLKMIGVLKESAWKLRNSLVMRDYEKRLVKFGREKNLSVVERWRQIRKTMDTKGYKECCRNTKISPNIFYQWMIERRCSLLLALYYSIK